MNEPTQALINALNADQREIAALQLAPLAETVITDPPLFQQTLDLLEYHGEPAMAADLIGIVWPVVASSQDRRLIRLRNELATRATDNLVFAALADDSAASLDVLGARLQTYFPIDEDGLGRYLAVLKGAEARDWVLADFEVLPQAVSPELTPPAIAEHLTTLLLEFMAVAWQAGEPFSRANLARQELPVYFAMRRSGQLDPRGSIGDLMRGSRPFPTSSSAPPHPLLPDQTTFESYLSQLLHFAKPQPYRAAAFYDMVPVWLQFLAGKGLADNETRERVSAEIDAMRPQLTEFWQKYSHDPALSHKS